MSSYERPLGPGYRIELFAESRTVTDEHVLALWARETQITEEMARTRLAEVLMVATDPQAGLVGVATAYLQRNRQLRLDLWHQRVFVATDHRMSGISLQLGNRAVEHLERRFVSGEDTRGAGIAFEVENAGYRRRFPEAVGTMMPAVFIGVNRRDQPVYVRYFPGALAPLPS